MFMGCGFVDGVHPARMKRNARKMSREVFGFTMMTILASVETDA
jgi:hypothetical protein